MGHNVARILMAAEFAANRHKDQKRKYTGDPYIIHPLSVARMVADAGGSEEIIQAALLHDTIEDTGTAAAELRTIFGSRVTDLVIECTEVSRPEDGSREVRKAMDRRHFIAASPDGQTIKLADFLDNARTILLHDKAFSVVFMKEKQELLRGMTRGNPTLYHDAQRVISEYFKNMEMRA